MLKVSDVTNQKSYNGVKIGRIRVNADTEFVSLVYHEDILGTPVVDIEFHETAERAARTQEREQANWDAMERGIRKGLDFCEMLRIGEAEANKF